jgi:hypothetical protein
MSVSFVSNTDQCYSSYNLNDITTSILSRQMSFIIDFKGIHPSIHVRFHVCMRFFHVLYSYMYVYIPISHSSVPDKCYQHHPVSSKIDLAGFTLIEITSFIQYFRDM